MSPINTSLQADHALAAVGHRVLCVPPLGGAVFVFRNRSATALKLLLYDGQGYWLRHQATLTGALSVVDTPGGRTGPSVSQKTPRTTLEWAALASPGR